MRRFLTIASLIVVAAGLLSLTFMGNVRSQTTAPPHFELFAEGNARVKGSSILGPNALDAMNEWTTTYLADVSTDGSSSVSGRTYVVFHETCTLKSIYTVLHGPITVADATINVYHNGFSPVDTQQVSGVTLTIAFSGSSKGDVDSDTSVTANGSTDVFAAGDTISFVSDGGSTDTAPMSISVLCKRGS